MAKGRGGSPVSMRAARFHARPGVAFVPIADAPPVEYGPIRRRDGDTARVRVFAETLYELAELAEPAGLPAR
ncbi:MULTISPECIES: hypothetical protein [unclassified Nocardia]|uniref:hypothetical protein n=1 Tax=unclassified Nocardia TaxID=2637762 RepID=UPI0024A7A5A0|nr:MULTISPECIES: hypothetical protein [unclassified Nocardia]